MKLAGLILLLCLGLHPLPASCTGRGDAILGNWTSNEKVLTIQIYREAQEYKARIVSFTDHHNPTPSDQRTDVKNPNPALRSRKMIGMTVITGLKYHPADNTWEDGEMYHAGSGKTYSTSMELTPKGELAVRVYKGFSFIGKTLLFHR